MSSALTHVRGLSGLPSLRAAHLLSQQCSQVCCLVSAWLMSIASNATSIIYRHTNSAIPGLGPVKAVASREHHQGIPDVFSALQPLFAPPGTDTMGQHWIVEQRASGPGGIRIPLRPSTWGKTSKMLDMRSELALCVPEIWTCRGSTP